jgi:hypothetical protein
MRGSGVGTSRFQVRELDGHVDDGCTHAANERPEDDDFIEVHITPLNAKKRFKHENELIISAAQV